MPVTEFQYKVVDVFTERQLEGNALAVFTDASGMDGATMQRVARELNLAETAFILPPTRDDCVARVRIFTPAKEMLFAGHPTIGTSYVLFDGGRIPPGSNEFVLEENIGPVPVRLEPGDKPMFWLRTPTIKDGPTYDRSICAKVLGLSVSDLLDITPQLLSAGNPTAFVAVKTKEAVDKAWLDLTGMKELRGNYAEPMCVYVFTPTAEGAYSRMFAPEYGIAEDPATGSSAGPLAVYMMRNKLVTGSRFISEQGTQMGRRSLLHVRILGNSGLDGVEVGGHVTPLATGIMNLNQPEPSIA